MSKFNFTVLLAVVKTLYSTITKKNTHALLISEKNKKDTVINFKNGSSITLLPKIGDSVRGKRAMLYPLYNNDGTVDYYFDKKKFDEVFMPFCPKKENDDINEEIIHTNNTKIYYVDINFNKENK